MIRDNGLPGYDNWLTRELDLDGNEPPELAVFTESDAAKLVEEMRAKCEAIARLNPFAHALDIADAIAALRRPS